MTKVTIALTALFSVCVAAGQTVGADSPGTQPGGGTISDAVSTSKGADLVSFLELTEGQIQSLRLLEEQFEDELFPLVRDSWEKEWQLRRLYRSETPNETSAAMLHQQVATLYEQVQSLRARHREQSRALLKYKQLTALGRLETVLELAQAAEDAVCANLLEGPHYAAFFFGSAASAWGPLGASAWGPLGSPPCGLGSGIPAAFGGRIERKDSGVALPSDQAN